MYTIIILKVNPKVRNVIAKEEVGLDNKLIHLIEFGSTVFNQVSKIFERKGKSMLFINKYRVISLR